MKSLAIILLCLPLFAIEPPSDEQQLRDLDQQLVVATYGNDPAWFEKNLTDDYVLTTSSGKVITKADLLKQFSAGFKMEPYKPTEVAVKIYGTTAIVTGRILQRYVAGEQKVEADLRYTDVWMKIDGNWKQVVGHASPISVKREKV